MKRIFLLVIFLLSLQSISFCQIAATRTPPEVPRFEAGAFFGQPIGVSVKYWFNSINAVDVLAAWSFSDDGIFELDGSYLLHYYYPNIRTGTLPLYVGLGGGFRIGDDWFIGARFPIGAEYLFEDFPIAVFAEVDPQWQFIPDNQFAIGGGVGIRVAIGKAPAARTRR